MKRTFINGALLLCIFLLIAGISALQSLPKAVIIDRLLSRAGLHLLAQDVEETLFRVSFKKAQLFRGNSQVLHLDKLSILPHFVGLKVVGRCEKGYLLGTYNLQGGAKIEFKGFSCLAYAGKVEGKVSLKEGIRGRIVATDVKLEQALLEHLQLNFKGKNFDGEIRAMGVSFKGGGSIRLRKENLLDSEVSASFRSNLGTIVVMGKLRSLSVQLRGR